MGWTAVMICACAWPLNPSRIAATSDQISPMRAARVNSATSLRRRRWYAATARTNSPPVRYAPNIVCGNVTSSTGFASSAQKFVITARCVCGSIV
jgi:hypothetical protein